MNTAKEIESSLKGVPLLFLVDRSFCQQAIDRPPSVLALRRFSPVTANPRFAVEAQPFYFLAASPACRFALRALSRVVEESRASGIPIEEFVGDEDSES